MKIMGSLSSLLTGKQTSKQTNKQGKKPMKENAPPTGGVLVKP